MHADVTLSYLFSTMFGTVLHAMVMIDQTSKLEGSPNELSSFIIRVVVVMVSLGINKTLIKTESKLGIT